MTRYLNHTAAALAALLISVATIAPLLSVPPASAATIVLA